MQRRNEETEGAGELPAPLKIFKHYLLWLIRVKPQAINSLPHIMRDKHCCRSC